MTPDFSIIVPVYNVEPYLRACVDSILAQTFPGFELFLVDDGSPDGCGAICDEYAARDGRVTVIHQPNQGVTAARKAGLDRAGADYVCFVDSDDTVKPAWLETIHACIVENHRPDIVLFGYEKVWEDAARPPKQLTPPMQSGYYDKARLEREIYPHMIIDCSRRYSVSEPIGGYLWAKAFRRSLLLDHFTEDTSIVVFEDVSMLYECLYHANSLVVCHALLYSYCQRGDSAIHTYEIDRVRNLERSRRYLADHLCREAPQFQRQFDLFFTYRLITSIRRKYHQDHSLRLTINNIVPSLKMTGLAGKLHLRRDNPTFFLFLLLLKLHLWYPAVFLAAHF